MNTVSNQSQGSVWGSQPILSLCRSLKQDMWFMLFIQTSRFFYTNRNAFKHTKPTVPDNIFVFVLSSDVAAKLPISFTKSLQLIFQFSKMWEQKSSKAPKYLFILNPWFRAHCLPTREIKEKDRVLTAAATPRFGS